MDQSEARLAQLKAKMSDTQRREMADILGAELRKRQASGSQSTAGTATVSATRSQVRNSKLAGSLPEEDLRGMYAEVNQTLKQIKTSKLEKELRNVKRRVKSSYRTGISGNVLRRLTSLGLGKGLLVAAIVSLAVLKAMIAVGMIETSAVAQAPISRPTLDLNKLNSSVALSTPPPQPNALPAAVEPSRVRSNPPISHVGNWTDTEKELLTSLDKRRVEIEQRKIALDERESDIKNQSEALAERLAELRNLTSKLSEARQDKDRRYQERLEQLANVYGSMQPKEAAPLIAKLEDPIALGLLQRLPGKRMGQILSLMNPDRAIDLTRSLTDRQKVE